MNTDARIMIAVLTYKRESALMACIQSIQRSCQSAKLAASIVIGDNDPDSTLNDSGTFINVRRVHLGKGSVVAGRQALLDLARKYQYDYLIFIDDDETVSEDWLESILVTSTRYECSAVAGPVIPTNIPDREFALHSRACRVTGSKMQSAGAGNLLLILEHIRGIDFDVSWPLSGGEDTDFTHRISQQGGLIIWSNEATVYEPVINTRRSKFWIIKRYFNNGRILHVIKVRGGNTQYRMEFFKRLLVATSLLVLYPIAFFSNSTLRFILDHSIRHFGYVYQSIRSETNVT